MDKRDPNSETIPSAPNVTDRYGAIMNLDLPSGEQLGVDDNRHNVQYTSVPILISDSRPTEIHHVHNEGQPPQREVVIVERPVIIYNDPYPVVSKGTAWIILLINILFPGVGTMIIGCLGVKNPIYFLCWGLFQLLTAFFILGWILAIQTSIALILKAE